MGVHEYFYVRLFGFRKFRGWHLFLTRRWVTYQHSHSLEHSSNRLKWFGQNIIRANSARLRFVQWLKRANKKHYGDVFQLLVSFDVFANLITIARWHENICENYIRGKVIEPVNCLLAVADSQDMHTFVRERKVDNFLNGGRIVGK